MGNLSNEDIKRYTFEYIMRNQFGAKGCHPNDSYCIFENRINFIYPYFEDFFLKEGDRIILGGYYCSEILLCEITKVIIRKRDIFCSSYEFKIIDNLYKLSEYKWSNKKNLKYYLKKYGKFLFRFFK